MTDLFTHITDQRNQIADTLENLTQEQWSTTSLCADWTVQEVAGHLTTGWNVGLGQFALGLAKARGNFARANERFGRQLGARPTDQIVADLRDNAADRFTPPGTGPEAPLIDCIVHSQDMFIPLDIAYEVDPNTVAFVMDAAVGKKMRRISGTTVAERFSLEATDTTWRHDNPGQPLLEGPVLALLLTIFARTAGHTSLSGPTQDI
ncbi:MAG: maleylpyruvate isomerase family mycothiol-dependent enzyme [Acidobacteria bacterium]|nr:maleylpyruvate isomerase family mycothiol-dependent enzyme [Acidobacteriota bacterium]